MASPSNPNITTPQATRTIPRPFIFQAGCPQPTPSPSPSNHGRRRTGTRPSPASERHGSLAGDGSQQTGSSSAAGRTERAGSGPDGVGEEEGPWRTTDVLGGDAYRVGEASSSASTIIVRGFEVTEWNQGDLQGSQAGSRLDNRSNERMQGSSYNVLHFLDGNVVGLSQGIGNGIHAGSRPATTPDRMQRLSLLFTHTLHLREAYVENCDVLSISNIAGSTSGTNGFLSVHSSVREQRLRRSEEPAVRVGNSSQAARRGREVEQGLAQYSLLEAQLAARHADFAREQLRHQRRTNELKGEMSRVEAEMRGPRREFNIERTIPMLPDSAWDYHSPERLWGNMSAAVRSVEILFNEVRAQRISLQNSDSGLESGVEENHRVLQQRISYLRELARLEERPNRHRAAAVREDINAIKRLMLWSNFLFSESDAEEDSESELQSQSGSSRTTREVNEHAERDPCTICLERLETGSKEKLQEIEKCGHLFHLRCIMKWLGTKNTCPLCREMIVTE